MKAYMKIVLLSIVVFSLNVFAQEKVRIKAIGIPLADHYAGIIAYEKYKDSMQIADYSFLLLPGPNLVRSYFNSYTDADIAFNVSVMVMDMFSEKQNFKWVGLIHRDGNALTINSAMNKMVQVHSDKTQRKPDARLIQVIDAYNIRHKKNIEFAIPSPLATHTTILYKYLKDYNRTLGFDNKADVRLCIVKPPKSSAYLNMKSTLNIPAAFEQSLPWSEVAESQGLGHVAWYSKDVLKHPKGHVECIIIAKDDVIANKREALREVLYYIQKAAKDIEDARVQRGKALEDIVKMIRKHIPKHTREAILESLRVDIMAINYKNLNIDAGSIKSFQKIMNLAYEAKFIDNKIDVNALVDDSFNVDATMEELRR